MKRDRQQDAAERIEMGDRVERQPPDQLGGAVAQPIGREGVGELVDREADEQHDRDDDDARDEVVRAQGPFVRVVRIVAARVAGGRKAPPLEPAEQVRLLALELLGADRAAVAQVGQAGQRAGQLVRAQRRRSAGVRACRPTPSRRRRRPGSARRPAAAGWARCAAAGSARIRRPRRRARTRAWRRASPS